MSILENWNATTNTTDGDDDLRVFPNARVDVAFTVFSILVFGFCSLIIVLGMCRKLALAEANRAGADHEEAVPHESKEERRKRKEERRSQGARSRSRIKRLWKKFTWNRWRTRDW